MKEATGELNTTVIVVITIAILSTFFFTVIWPMLNNNLKANTKCADAYCPLKNGKIQCTETNKGTNKCITVKCQYKGETIICPYKG